MPSKSNQGRDSDHLRLKEAAGEHLLPPDESLSGVRNRGDFLHGQGRYVCREAQVTVMNSHEG